MDMKSKIPTLERWARFHNVLVGYAYDHEEFKNGQRIITNHYDRTELGIAYCAGGEIWKLGNPGTVDEHYQKQPKKFIPDLKKVFEFSLDRISDIRRSL